MMAQEGKAQDPPAVRGTHFYLIGWFIFLTTFPIYTFQSGLPQPADLWMAVLILLLGLSQGLFGVRAARPVIRQLGMFVAYVALVSLLWTMRTGDLSIIAPPLFYAYDLLLFAAAITLYSRFGRSFLTVTVHGIAAATFVQFLLAGRLPFTGVRVEVFFNNPNQLGYFTLLSATVFMMISSHVRLHLFYQILFFALVGYLALLSQSKAALAAMLLFGLVALGRRSIAMTFALVAMITLLQFSPFGVDLRETLERRFTSSQEDESLAGRGYDRILNHPHHLVFGAAEGGYDRFDSELAGELHSTLGTIIFSYGIPGALFLVTALIKIIRMEGVISGAYLIPIFVYSFFHQGLRFPMFWVMLAVLFCSGLLSRTRVSPQERDRQASPMPLRQLA